MYLCRLVIAETSQHLFLFETRVASSYKMAAEATPTSPGTKPADSMHVRVLTLGKGDFELLLPTSSSVDHLRKVVADRQTDSNTSRVRLMYRGRLLQDGHSLQSCGIQDGQTVHLVLRPAESNAASTSASQPQAAQQSTFRPTARSLQQPGPSVSQTVPVQAVQQGGGFSGAPLPAPPAAAGQADVHLRVDTATINAARRLSADTIHLRHSANRTPSVEIGASQNALPNVVVASSLRNVHRFMHAVEPQVLNLAEAYHMINFVPPGPQRDALQRSTFAVARELQSIANAANGLAQVLANVRLGQQDAREFHLDPNMPVQWSDPSAATQPPQVSQAPPPAASASVALQGSAPSAPVAAQAGTTPILPHGSAVHTSGVSAGVSPSVQPMPAVQVAGQTAAPMQQLPAALQQLLGMQQQQGAGVSVQPHPMLQGMGQLIASLTAAQNQNQNQNQNPPGAGGSQQN